MLRFLDSFDAYGAVGANLSTLKTTMSGKWDSLETYVGGNTAFELVDGVYGGIGLSFNFNYDSLAKTFDNQQIWILGFWIQFSIISNNNYVLQLLDGTNNQVSLRTLTSPTRLGVYAVDTLVNSVNISTGQWYFLELYADIQNGASGYCELKLDNITVVSGNADTSRSGANQASSIKFFTQTNRFYIDDLYIADGQPGINTFLGQSTISVVYPESDVVTNWAPSTGSDHYALINDTVRNTSTYVSTDTNNAVDSFIFPAGGYGSTIHGVQLCLEVASDGSDPKELEGIITFDSNESAVTKKVLGGINTPDTILIPAEYQINTTNAWTSSSIHAANFGCKKLS